MGKTITILKDTDIITQTPEGKLVVTDSTKTEKENQHNQPRIMRYETIPDQKNPLKSGKKFYAIEESTISDLLNSSNEISSKEAIVSSLNLQGAQLITAVSLPSYSQNESLTSSSNNLKNQKNTKAPISLPQHTAKIHGTELANALVGTEDKKKTISCQYCGKGFMHRFHLQTHMRTHTGERPFQCYFCEKSFTVKCNRDRHMKTLHRAELSNMSSLNNSQFGETNSMLSN